MRTKEELESLFEYYETIISDIRQNRKTLRARHKPNKFWKYWVASRYSIDVNDNYLIIKNAQRKLNHLRQALWKYSVYKDLKYKYQ
jgi:hypothetical protein